MNAYRVDIQYAAGQTVATLYVRAFTMESALKKARGRLGQLKLNWKLDCIAELPKTEILP